MATTFRFRQFLVYKDARIFIQTTKRLARKQFPAEERFALTSQLCRALDSVILNIAEGADRSTDLDFAHFLNLSHTSLNEVVACFDVALDLTYISQKEHSVLLKQASKLVDQITAFRRKLLRSQ